MEEKFKRAATSSRPTKGGSFRDNRDNRSNKDDRGGKGRRDNRDYRNNKDDRGDRGDRGRRDNRDYRSNKDDRGDRVFRDNKENKEWTPLTARQIAYRALKKIYEQSLFIDVALENQRDYAKLTPQDKAFARWLVAGVVRYQKRLNEVLTNFWRREPDLHIKIILQMGALQLLLGDNAEHAVVSETVSLCGKKDSQFRGLINAILRNIIRENIEDFNILDPIVEYPRWILNDWSKTFGQQTAEDIARHSLSEADVDISFKMESEKVLLELTKARPLPGGGARLKGHKGRVSRLSGFKNGAFWVQDAAAQLPVKLLGDIKGKKILDLCAAPGGKSMQMVAAGANVTALDAKERRMQRLVENFERIKLEVETITEDMLDWQTDEKYDVVMLDAPCSATGTLRRHPEILRQIGKGDIEELVELQKTMLKRATSLVADDGVLVYCVCSLQSLEGIKQIEAFLSEHNDWELIDLKDKLEALKLGNAYHKACAYTHPALWQKIGGMDGFFVALLQPRNKN
ncbi:MAG: RsmB/NOP family class I SAM-dependent RNA methyltransferase [Alphaproteobacteria bacterium]